MVYSQKQRQTISQRGRFESQIEDSTKEDIYYQKELVFSKGCGISDCNCKCKNLTEKKRVYFSDYGFANSREVIRGDTDILEKNPINFDKFYQENLIKWWKNKASKRYESLKSSGSLRKELEVWTKDMHIDIIR